MAQKKIIVERLNELIVKFEALTKIKDFAIIFNKRVVLAPHTTRLTKESVSDILKDLRIKNLTKNLQNGEINLIEFVCESGGMYYARCTQQIRLIALSKTVSNEIKEGFIQFAKSIKNVVDQSVESDEIDTTEEDVNKHLRNLDEMAKKFNIPEFESYKKLVKAARNFQKEAS